MALSDKQSKIFKEVVRVAESNGMKVRLAGGAVRDVLSGKEPKDLDFAIDAVPERVSRAFSARMHRVIPTGLKHGTVTVVVLGVPVEITTLRIDLATDGRHAEVEFTDDWKKDAERRDLTMNSMFMDLDGTVIDFFGGKEDLEKGLVRFVGDAKKRIEEDHLRILRYFRFFSYIRHEDRIFLDDDAIQAIFESSRSLKSISGERIWKEMTKILESRNRTDTISLMDVLGVLDSLEAGFVLDDWNYEELIRLDLREETRSSIYGLAALIPDMDSLGKMVSRLKPDSNSINIVGTIVNLRSKGIDLSEYDPMNLVVECGMRPEMIMHYAIYSGLGIDAVSSLTNNTGKFPVSGKDVLDAGIPKGPEVGKSLDRLKIAWSSSGFKLTKDELMGML